MRAWGAALAVGMVLLLGSRQTLAQAGPEPFSAPTNFRQTPLFEEGTVHVRGGIFSLAVSGVIGVGGLVLLTPAYQSGPVYLGPSTSVDSRFILAPSLFAVAIADLVIGASEIARGARMRGEARRAAIGPQAYWWVLPTLNGAAAGVAF